jgi:hypothetical protein
MGITSDVKLKFIIPRKQLTTSNALTQVPRIRQRIHSVGIWYDPSVGTRRNLSVDFGRRVKLAPDTNLLKLLISSRGRSKRNTRDLNAGPQSGIPSDFVGSMRFFMKNIFSQENLNSSTRANHYSVFKKIITSLKSMLNRLCNSVFACPSI